MSDSPVAPRAASKGYHRLRRGRVSEPCRAYLVTTVCADRRTIFSKAEHARVAHRELETTENWPAADPLAWVLMPDHWHGLLMLQGDESLGRTLQRIKSRITAALLRSGSGILKPVWQAGFHDHALRREEDVVEVVRYILANPARAGLVAIWSDWPYRGGRMIGQLEPSAII